MLESGGRASPSIANPCHAMRSQRLRPRHPVTAERDQTRFLPEVTPVGPVGPAGLLLAASLAFETSGKATCDTRQRA